jgi:lipid-binding SYLF domain-containing protein
MNNRSYLGLALGAVLMASACGGAGWTPEQPPSQTSPVAGSAKAQTTVARFLAKQPKLRRYFDSAYGVAVFPTVGKGSMGIGGGYGEGEVFEGQRRVGATTLLHLTAGLALGGQAYSELIFFRDAAALRRFQDGNFELGAQASAVAVEAGVSSDASYEDGVAVFTMTRGGLMYEAAVAGQKFSYRAL